MSPLIDAPNVSLPLSIVYVNLPIDDVTAANTVYADKSCVVSVPQVAVTVFVPLFSPYFSSFTA